MSRLYRSKNDRIIAGVCGGIAEYFNIDPTLVRIVFAILIFVFGLSIWIYPVLWIIIPEEPMSVSGSSKNGKVDEGEIVS